MVNFFSLVKKKKRKGVAIKKRVRRLKRPARAKIKVSKAKPKRKETLSRKRTLLKKEILVGKIVHYFPKVQAGVIKITKGTIALGDLLHFKGHTTDFKQIATSLQINRAPIKKAKIGDEIGILVNSRVRRRDSVYKV